jgi:electron transport complex protein RnfB
MIALADLVRRLDAALPQTQCGRCGHDGCAPYAAAIAAGAPIDRCPPGGEATVAALAALTGRPVVPLDGRLGRPGPLLAARIDEAYCIGCTLCIDACPVDAIAGAPKRMHTVLAALCTGCELCLPPCPVACIDLVAAGRDWSAEDARAARMRYAARRARIADDAAAAAAVPPHGADVAAGDAAAARQAAIAAALARARGRRAPRAGTPERR